MTPSEIAWTALAVVILSIYIICYAVSKAGDKWWTPPTVVIGLGVAIIGAVVAFGEWLASIGS